MSKWIHNLSNTTKNYHNHDIVEDEFFHIPDNEVAEYTASAALISDLALGAAKMSRDGITDLPGTGPQHVDFLRGTVDVIAGGTDGATIGNVGDALKVVSTPASFDTVMIDFAHEMVHKGRAFQIDHVYTLNSGANHDHVFITPATGTRYPHFTWAINSSDDCEILLYEAPTCTEGDEIVAYNRNRNSANTNGTKAYDIGNITSLGTKLMHKRVGMGNGEHGAEGTTNSFSEIILKANTKYLFRIKSNANGNIIGSTSHWYEYDYTTGTG